MANHLTRETQTAVVNALVEGCSMRSAARLTGVDRETVGTLLARVGDGCAALLDDTMRDLPCRRLELDELWAYVGKHQRYLKPPTGTDLGDDPEQVGDTWTWLATCAETKLVPTFFVGKREQLDADSFVGDLASRLRDRHAVQISTDGLKSYEKAIGNAFNGVVSYAQVIKSYEAEPIGPGRYSPPRVSGVQKAPIYGAPVAEFVSTSYAERNNLNVRMGCRRYTRLTNAFSKKLDQHVAATALHFAHYNFVRVHKTIRTSPAMAAGVSRTLWELGDLMEAALDGVRP